MPLSSKQPDTPRIAIVGAGLAGLACAQQLSGAGLAVTVFERGGEPGGRLASLPFSENGHVDLGAQYFTARDATFLHVVEGWRKAGLCAPWSGLIVSLGGGQATATSAESRYVGIPTMATLAQHLARDQNVVYGALISTLGRDGHDWQIGSQAGAVLAGFTHVLIATTPAQALPLVAASASLTKEISAVTMLPCWAVVARFELAVAASFDGAFLQNSPLAWIARDNSKPGRGNEETWVLHSTGQWSEQKREAPAAQVVVHLLHALRQAWPHAVWRPRESQAYLWPESRPAEPLAQRALFDAELRLGVCGDWCGGPRVEGAYLSGVALAQQVLDSL